MASPSTEVEDQTDEDFFDKLVNDDDGISFTGSRPSPVKADDLVETKTFLDLSVSDVGPTRVDSIGDFSFSVKESEAGEDGVVLAASNDSKGGVVVTESNAVIPSSVNKSSEAGLVEEDTLNDCAREKSGAMGMKEVQWSSFNSDVNVDHGSGLTLDSDFFNEFRDDSGDPPVNLGNTNNLAAEFSSKISVSENLVADLGSSNNQDDQSQNHGPRSGQHTDVQDLNSSHYGENLYPGWRYDSNTGIWHQLDGYDADADPSATRYGNGVQSIDVNARSISLSELRSDVYHLQQSAQSENTLGNVAKATTDVGLSNWNRISQGSAEYPAHMLFDPQYPSWYYDTITQEWKSLNQSTMSTYDQQFQNGNVDNHGSHVLGSQDYVLSWGGSVSDRNQKDTIMWQAQSVDKSETTGFIENKQLDNQFGLSSHLDSSLEWQMGFRPSGSVAPFEETSQIVSSTYGVSGFQNFIPSQQPPQHHYQTKIEPTQHMFLQPAYFDGQKPGSYSQQQLQSSSQFSYAPSEGPTSAGRPSHALVTFGFGGKLVVLKNKSSHTSKDLLGGVVNVLNLMELVMEKSAISSFGMGACDYFHAFCQQSFPGPLVGGNVGNKELNKWVDERIVNCESSNIDCRDGEAMRLLFSLLKISCQYYGKLRSPFGTDLALKENDCPESAVAQLLGSSRRNDVKLSDYGSLAHWHCLQNLPTEAQSQATALEVQRLLVAGRKREALESAKEGYLWGPALILASQLGDQFYGDTVKQMALKQLVAGSPLRTLCLLIAGQPADVFSHNTPTNMISVPLNRFQQSVHVGSNCMLDKWEENLAIITANRTKGDELVIIHLGDCLWKERGEVTAAHVCYLVAESDLEPYSDSARLCLIGADHWKFPRTYASPSAIQRTELYEYAKVLGNSQFLLLPFQPYKLIYAYMLAEVGKVVESLKYCQALLKSLRTGRAPEVDTWKQLVLSLEERLRIHQQSGYTANLTPTKLVGKLRTFFDSATSRVAGGLPPPIPSKSSSSILQNEFSHQPGSLGVSNSQSAMLMPSGSVETISEWSGENNQLSVPNRSISEPDFGRPRKVGSSEEAGLPGTQEKASASGRSSLFGLFGSQLIQRTMGLVLRSRQHKQAKLGDKNKFYYDEKLKRWVEERAEPLAQEAVLAPPPTFSAFQKEMPNNNANDDPVVESFHTGSWPENHNPIASDYSPSIPPTPPCSNQFSAQGRMGVRSRYVDTFNKGGGTTAHLFQSPTIPSSRAGGVSNPKFFIPTPVASGEKAVQATGESIQEHAMNKENSPTSFTESFFPPPPSALSSSAVIMHRFPSMDNIVQKRTKVMEDADNSIVSHSRRAASWSGRLNDADRPPTSFPANSPNQFSDGG